MAVMRVGRAGRSSVVAVFALLTLVIAPAAARADLAFPVKEKDFGDVAISPNPTVEFAFTNTGDEPVTIHKLKTTSPSTQFEWPREPIAPGASGVVTVTVTTRHGGPFRHELYVVVGKGEDEQIVETLVLTGRFPARPFR